MTCKKHCGVFSICTMQLLALPKDKMTMTDKCFEQIMEIKAGTTIQLKGQKRALILLQEGVRMME